MLIFVGAKLLSVLQIIYWDFHASATVSWINRGYSKKEEISWTQQQGNLL